MENDFVKKRFGEKTILETVFGKPSLGSRFWTTVFGETVFGEPGSRAILLKKIEKCSHGNLESQDTSTQCLTTNLASTRATTATRGGVDPIYPGRKVYPGRGNLPGPGYYPPASGSVEEFGRQPPRHPDPKQLYCQRG